MAPPSGEPIKLETLVSWNARNGRILEIAEPIIDPFHGVARHVAENRLEVASADRVQRITGVGRILGFLGTESDVLGGKGPLGYGGKPVSVLGRLEGIGRENCA